jgi:hypothetical protein
VSDTQPETDDQSAKAAHDDGDKKDVADITAIHTFQWLLCLMLLL